MSGSDPKRGVVIDTNLFISGTIMKRGDPFTLLELWRVGSFHLITSQEQIAELDDVLDRPMVRIDYALSNIEVDEHRHRLRRLATIVVPILPSPIALRDLKDDFLLATALAGNADFLVTGDKDLVTAAGDSLLGRLHIVTVTAFLQEQPAG